MEVKNLEYHYDSEKIENVEELEQDFDGCVNHIIVKPEVNINVTIEGLETTMFAETGDKKDTEDNKCMENHNVCDGVNHIVIKPKIIFDVNISGLNTQINI